MVAGLAGVLVSPSRGLFVYAPVLLFSVAGLAAWLVRRRGGVLACAALAAAVGVATIAQFSVWWGGHSFGPRLLTDVLPAVVLGLVPIWPGSAAGRSGERCSPSPLPFRSWWRSWGPSISRRLATWTGT